MTDADGGNGQAGGEAAAAEQPRLSVTAQYIKDLSFENPNAPTSLAPPSERPQIDINVDVGHRALGPTNYEVVLRIDVKAALDGKALFMVELEYAGLFQFENIPAESIEAVCMMECPRHIFPFARRIIADVTRDGGFPPMMIDPIDFAGLYRQRLAQAQGASPAAAGEAGSA